MHPYLSSSIPNAMVFTSNATDVEHHTTFLIQMDVVFDFSELQDL